MANPELEALAEGWKDYARRLGDAAIPCPAEDVLPPGYFLRSLGEERESLQVVPDIEFGTSVPSDPDDEWTGPARYAESRLEPPRIEGAIWTEAATTGRCVRSWRAASRGILCLQKSGLGSSRA